MNYELAALANKGTQFTGGVVQRKCDKFQKEHALQLATRSVPDSMPPIVHEVLRSPGAPLDANSRDLMESSLGHDFSRVRVHTDGKAAESARSVDALAYTVGLDVVFGKGYYSPRSNEGQRLIAHELMHVVQQWGQSPSNPLIQRKSKSGTITSVSQWDNLSADAQRAIDKIYFNKLDPDHQNAFRSVYKALVAEGLWDEIVHIFNVSVGGTRGIKADSKRSMISRLSSNANFCRDIFQSKWRQMVKAGTEGLHFSYITPNRISVHLDTIAPVAGREPNGNCRYSMPHLLPHAGKDWLGLRNVEIFPPPGRETQPGEVQPAIRFRIPGT
jgi:hypothetical protein